MRLLPCLAAHLAFFAAGRGARGRLVLWLAAACLVGEAGEAHAQDRRRAQREIAADSATPTPSYGEAARGLGRVRRPRRKAPVRRSARPPVVKNDSGEVEAIEEVDTDAAAVVGTSDGPDTWWGDAWPVWDRVMDSFTARPVRKHTVNTLISHRSAYGIGQNPLWNAFGIDGFNSVGLGVRVGILDQLDVGVERWGNQLSHDTYEFDVRGQLLSQNKFAIDLGLRVGATWFAQEHANDAAGALVEMMVGRLFFSRLYTGFNLIYHSSSSGPYKTDADSHSSMAVQLLADMRITSGFALAAEVTPAVAGYHLRYPVITVGPRFVTNRHTFTIAWSNTSYFSTDSIVVNTDRINPKYWKLGFHLTREL